MTHDVLQYYSLIDQEKIDAALSLFARECIYHRGERTLRGIAEIKQFYQHQRRLRGTHLILNSLQTDNKVAVVGRFNGVNGKEEVSFGFIDFFILDKAGTISERYTYVQNGHNF